MKDIKDTKTSVALSSKTKEQLANFGNKGESYDTILQRVMSCIRSCSSSEILIPLEHSIKIDVESFGLAKRIILLIVSLVRPSS